MLPSVLNLYKEIGETPLARIERFKADNPEYAKSKMSYAGRLDPMAEGVLVVLVDGENKNREKYLNLSKKYTAEVLFGIETDTHDVLGKIIEIHEVNESADEIRNNTKECAKSLIGVQNHKYPAYSSKNVDGKSLFQWAREGRISEVEIPERKVEIFSMKVLKMHTLSQHDLLAQVKERIGLVKGDFRQIEILASWKERVNKKESKALPVATIEILCSSGTYIRVLAHELGNCLKTGALLLSLKRNSVGGYSIRNSIL